MTKQETVSGFELCPEDRARVMDYMHTYQTLAGYRHATKPGHSNTILRVEFRSAQEWLYNTRFYVKQDGRLDLRYHKCHSFRRGY